MFLAACPPRFSQDGWRPFLPPRMARPRREPSILAFVRSDHGTSLHTQPAGRTVPICQPAITTSEPYSQVRAQLSSEGHTLCDLARCWRGPIGCVSPIPRCTFSRPWEASRSWLPGAPPESVLNLVSFSCFARPPPAPLATPAARHSTRARGCPPLPPRHTVPAHACREGRSCQQTSARPHACARASTASDRRQPPLAQAWN